MSFDTLATYYCWLERITAGRLLQRCRTQFIDELKDARHILLLGEGRGRFLMELTQLNPAARITCLDASQGMLAAMREKARRRPRAFSSCSGVILDDGTQTRKGSEHRIEFVHANVLEEHWHPWAERYDAIASHFFLDCFTPDQVAQICSNVSASAQPGARWLISDFCVPQRGWQRIRARWILWMMYRFFRWTTGLPAQRLTVPDAHLRAARLRLKQRKHFNHGLLHSDVWVRAPWEPRR